MTLMWRCDLCHAVSGSRMAVGFLLNDRAPGQRNRRTHRFHACADCAGPLALRLHQRKGTMPRGEAARCFCGHNGRTRIRVNTAPWDVRVHDYTHVGVLCPRHVQPLLDRAVPYERTESLTEGAVA